MKTQIIVLSLIAIFILNAIFVSADISWSLPNSVQFTTGGSNGGGNGGGGGGNDDGGNQINKKCNIFNDPYLIQDLETEKNFYNTKYGNWECINNKLQRTNIVQGKEITEYGGLCGVSANEENNKNSYLILAMLVLIILIIIALILIILAFLRR
mgnify:CR=1 FL=1